MRAPWAEWVRRVRAGLVPVALAALAPKCLACLAAYAGLGAALGLAGPELCGGADSGAGFAAPLLVLGASAAWLWLRPGR